MLLVNTSDGRFAAAIPSVTGGTELVYLGRKPEDPLHEQRDREFFEAVPFRFAGAFAWHGPRGDTCTPDSLQFISEFLLNRFHRSRATLSQFIQRWYKREARHTYIVRVCILIGHGRERQEQPDPQGVV
jgi:hypothetical protein